MTTFIEDVLSDLYNQNINFSETTFILPSKRAGVFLKSKLKYFITSTSFLPEIISVEEFIENISNLKQISGIELLFKFYNVYKAETKPENLEPFETFSKWAQILIQDFNEIDRYLINPDEVFDYMSASQVLKRWSLESSTKTKMIDDYIGFWERLKEFYHSFSTALINDRVAYQGLIYRIAAQKIDNFSQVTDKTHVFIGFNALNAAEEQIIKTLLTKNIAKVYWDADDAFINNRDHSAGTFIKQHKYGWEYYKSNPFHWVNNHYSNTKTIEVIGSSKYIGQSKYVGELLNKLKATGSVSNTAVVLGDENMLLPILNAIPESIGAVNVTMGLPLKSTPTASLFEQLLNIHNVHRKEFYYKDVISLLNNQLIKQILPEARMVILHLQNNNISQISKTNILEIIRDNKIVEILFGNWHVSVNSNIKKCLELIEVLRIKLSNNKSKNRLELEYLYRFNNLFNSIERLNSTYNYINSVSSLKTVYNELLNSATLDFQGEPLEGLQIMGMLESRVLDFETVIITSVNEGVLPGGKTNNSFIPFDFKVHKKLPTYKEKDAVYTYHFYNLIQRAKNIFLIYNTQVDSLKGGEKSRLITQLEVEGLHDIRHKLATPTVPKTEDKLIEIPKDNAVIEKIKSVAKFGFSPSSLTNYIRNPIDFYYEKILGISDFDDVEETIASNTLGTVVHNTLEDFYKPVEGQVLTIDAIEAMKIKIDNTVTFHFKKEFKDGDITSGKNLIIFEIAKRYVLNFLNTEIELLNSGNKLKIIAVEVENEVEINIPELNFPVKLRGKVDRIDELNGIMRIVDYKSGKVDQKDVEIINWEEITTDYKKFSKSFQVLCYAYMIHLKNKFQLPIEAGIISFKNLQNGFLRFGKKESSRGKKYQLITAETMLLFENQLKSLIIEICNPEINFIEKELD